MSKLILAMGAALSIHSCKPAATSESATKVSSSNKSTVALDSPARKMIIPLYSENIGIYCTATVIGKKTVITAAQCFYGSDADVPSESIKPVPKYSKNQNSYLIWNDGKDFPANSSIGDFEFSSKITRVQIAKNTKPGAMGILAPNPDIAIACAEQSFPDSIIASDIKSYDGAYSLSTLSQQKFRYYGYGANTDSGLGRGVLRQGNGKGIKNSIKQTSDMGPIDIQDDSSWFDRLNPFHKPDAACKGDAGGPVYIESSGTFAGVISTGRCDKDPKDAKGGLGFSPISREPGSSDWILEAIDFCENR